ncbi:hypothetical protein AB0F81_36950 [Actinoplanes sp. NPDC024001]|uniref:hypothetical protein n=1 Tax=Actinoplanes sp. NPDC024001 TaxID=3154598 RepID=UPI0033FB66A5
MTVGAGSGGRHRRRGNPRLSGTLHIQDANGHQLTVPLRGRASVLTAGGTGLTGYGEVWAVHTTPTSTETGLMIIYGPDRSADGRESGLCAAGETVELGGVRFTWRQVQPATVPQPRPAGPPRNLRVPPARRGNSREEPATTGAGLRQRLQNVVRVVTQSARH